MSKNNDNIIQDMNPDHVCHGGSVDSQRDEYAKQALLLNQIKAKLQGTSETWIAATLFVLNLSAFAARTGITF